VCLQIKKKPPNGAQKFKTIEKRFWLECVEYFGTFGVLKFLSNGGENFMDKSEEIQELNDYFFEKNSVGDYVEAVKTLEKLSDLGDVDATNLLGTMYRFGKDDFGEYGVEQDTKKALEYYTKGEDWFSIASIYYHGAPNIEPNIEEALKYCLTAVETNDTGKMPQCKAMELLSIIYPNEMDKCRAMGLLSLIYRDKSNNEESFKWFKQALQTGGLFLGLVEEFYDFYLRDAQDGNVKSMLILGNFERDRGNKTIADEWYKRALAWDNPENIYDADTIRQIGDWYRIGNEISKFIPFEQDTSKAILWLERAEDIFNDAESKEILYEIYRGFLTEEDNEE
jgi:tetratricopeptide (TPR) repeat protein